ncbi:TPR-like protein [Ceratobasidium sp. AG-I]|nr:TPR-like protein [Ceratobasidium sp. AG-I]
MDWLRKGFGSKSKSTTYDGTNTKDADISRMGDSGEGYDDDKTASPTSTFVSDLPLYKESKPTAEDSPFSEQFNRPEIPASSVPAVDELFDMLRPPIPSPVFTGRVEELEHIDTFFRQNPHGSELTLRGVSGSGKTQLALKFAQVTTFYSNIFYVGAGSTKRKLLNLLDQWKPLQTTAALDPMAQQGCSHSEIASVTSTTMTDSPSRIALVIFDDLDIPGFRHAYAFKRYMLEVFGFERVSVLYLLDVNTFRGYDIDQKTYCIPRSLEIEDAVRALAKSAYLQCGDLHVEAEETARDIVKYFDYYPVAIVQVGAAIRNSGLTLQEYWDVSAEDHQEQIKKIRTSLDYLWRLRHKTLSEASRTLLRLFLLFPVEDQSFFMNILTRARANLANYQPSTLTKADGEQIKDDDEQLLSLFTPNVKGSLSDSLTFKISLSELSGRFTPPSGDRGRGLYLCANGWAKDLISNSEFAGVSAAYLLAASIGSSMEYGAECRDFRSKLDGLTRSLLRSYPDACAHHRLRFSLVDEACGRWSEAIDMKKLAIETYKRELGLHHPETMFATTCLAKTYYQLGRWKDAKKVQSNLLDRQEEELGEAHPETLSTMHDLASTLSHMGRWEDEESLLERVCSSRRQALGETHPGTLSAMYSLASNYSKQGRWQEALELHENVLETRRRTLGEDHADTLSSMHSLATKHWESGQSTKNAEESNIRVLEARKKALGLEHPDTFSSLLALSAVYRKQGQWRLATDMAAEVLDMRKRVLGRDHIDAIQNMQNLASWYSEHGGLSDAINLHAEILESRRAVYGNGSPETLTSIGELVSLYWKQGLWAQAEGLHVELLRERKNTLGDGHPVCLATSLDLATHYLGQCRWREASLIFKEVLSIKRQDAEAEENDQEIRDIV